MPKREPETVAVPRSRCLCEFKSRGQVQFRRRLVVALPREGELPQLKLAQRGVNAPHDFAESFGRVQAYVERQKLRDRPAHFRPLLVGAVLEKNAETQLSLVVQAPEQSLPASQKDAGRRRSFLGGEACELLREVGFHTYGVGGGREGGGGVFSGEGER